MFKCKAFYRPLALTAVLVAGFSLGLPAHDSHAQSADARQASPHRVAPRDAVIGGYSTTLSDVWGPAEMPGAPRDFGPNFDFPAGGSISLPSSVPSAVQGPPDHSPYFQ
jgi:hypothetical protein